MSIISLRPHQDSANVNMAEFNKGVVVMPTGSGKTYTMVADAARVFESTTDKTIVVVAPTIVLTNQLSREFLDIMDVKNVMHVHSGGTRHFTSTHHQDIWGWCQFTTGHKLIFTTYHSLHRIQQSLINVDTIYFDESHNSVKRQWFDAVSYFSRTARRCYFFTASPKHSLTPDKPGMNNADVYGEVICEVPTTEMIREGYIVPPTLHTITTDKVVDGKYPAEVDIANLIKSVGDHHLKSVLVSCKNTTQLYHITNSERFTTFCDDQDYTIYSISSKYG